MVNTMSSGSYDELPEEHDGFNPETVEAVWPLLTSMGIINEDSCTPEDYKNHGVNHHNFNTWKDRLGVQLFPNKWGFDSFWFSVDELDHTLRVESGIEMDGKMEPENLQKKIAVMIQFRDLMLAAGYRLDDDSGVFDMGYYDLRFVKNVDLNDPQKTYSEVDKFLSLLT